MELRPYQANAIAAARDLINGGKRKVCLCAPCGAGKGLILARMMENARSRGKRVLAIVHRRELVEDLADRVERMGFRPGLILPGHDPRPERAVQVASIQTLARRDLPPADLVLVDECFPAGTLVSGRPIETIRPGDKVEAFNEQTGGFEVRTVTRVFMRIAPRRMVEIEAAGRVVVCTENHTFFTGFGGWVPAGRLAVGGVVLLRGGPARIDRVSTVERDLAIQRSQPPVVFNLEVEGLHTYVANGFVVHNCHHSTASTWRSVIDSYPRAAVVGTTATPCRLGGAPLGDVFQALVEVVKPAALVEDGFLVPVTGYAFDAPDLRGVRRSSGDYEPEEIARLMGGPKLRGSIVDSYMGRARGTRAIVFAVNVEHSRQIALDFARAGVQAEHVDGETPRALRRIIFERFRSGATRVLCNVGLFTEGVDLPAIQTVILARPTLSLSLALQMIGRGRRPVPCECGRIPHWRSDACECGRPVPKKATLIHDHAGVVLQHGLPDEPRVWSLDGDYRIDGKAKGAKGEESKAIRVCRSCLAIYLADEPQCPMCGKKNPAPKKLVRNGNGVAIPLASLEGGMRPIDANEKVRKRFFWFLLGLERQRGYKKKYAEIRYHGRFHLWPPSKLWREQFAKGLGPDAPNVQPQEPPQPAGEGVPTT